LCPLRSWQDAPLGATALPPRQNRLKPIEASRGNRERPQVRKLPHRFPRRHIPLRVVPRRWQRCLALGLSFDLPPGLRRFIAGLPCVHGSRLAPHESRVYRQIKSVAWAHHSSAGQAFVRVLTSLRARTRPGLEPTLPPSLVHGIVPGTWCDGWVASTGGIRRKALLRTGSTRGCHLCTARVQFVQRLAMPRRFRNTAPGPCV